MTDYIVRIKDITVPSSPNWTNGWCQTEQQMADIIAPVYRTASNTRLYLYECVTTAPLPIARALFPTVDPEDSNRVVVYVETLSGAPLFHFSFLLVEEGLLSRGFATPEELQR